MSGPKSVIVMTCTPSELAISSRIARQYSIRSPPHVPFVQRGESHCSSPPRGDWRARNRRGHLRFSSLYPKMGAMQHAERHVRHCIARSELPQVPHGRGACCFTRPCKTFQVHSEAHYAKMSFLAFDDINPVPLAEQMLRPVAIRWETQGDGSKLGPAL